MKNEVFSKKIKEIRENNNLTMQQLADKINVSKSSINMYENKGIIPRYEILIDISKTFNVSIDYLLGNDISSFKNNKKVLSIIKKIKRLDDEQLNKFCKILEIMFE